MRWEAAIRRFLDGNHPTGLRSRRRPTWAPHAPDGCNCRCLDPCTWAGLSVSFNALLLTGFDASVMAASLLVGPVRGPTNTISSLFLRAQIPPGAQLSRCQTQRSRCSNAIPGSVRSLPVGEGQTGRLARGWPLWCRPDENQHPPEPQPAAGRGGRAGLARLLDLAGPPTAVFVAGEVLAHGVLHEARARGVAIPGELAIAGCTDSPAAALVEPPLTMVLDPPARWACWRCGPSPTSSLATLSALAVVIGRSRLTHIPCQEDGCKAPVTSPSRCGMGPRSPWHLS